MKTSALLAGALLLAVAGAANAARPTLVINSVPEITPSETRTEVTRQIAGVTKLDVSSSLDVEYTPAAGNTVSVSAPENLMTFVKVENEGNELSIYLQGSFNLQGGSMRDLVKVHVTAPGIRDFEASSNAMIKINGDYTADSFSADAASNATITAGNVTVSRKAELEAASNATLNIATLRAGAVELEASSNAKVNIGHMQVAGKAEIEAASNAKVNITEIAGTARIEAEGVSNATLDIASLTAETLKVEAYSNAKVFVRAGSARQADFEAASNGKINASEFRAGTGSLEAASNGRITSRIAAPANISASSNGSINNNAR